MTSPALTPLRSGLSGGLIELRQAFSGAALAGQLLWPAATLIAVFFFRHRELAGSRFTIGALMLPGTLGIFVAFGMMLMVQYLPADAGPADLLAYLRGHWSIDHPGAEPSAMARGPWRTMRRSKIRPTWSGRPMARLSAMT